MKVRGWDKTVEKAVLRLLDVTSKKHGLKDVRHAANKWCVAQRDKLRLAKQRQILKRELADVNRRLSR